MFNIKTDNEGTKTIEWSVGSKAYRGTIFADDMERMVRTLKRDMREFVSDNGDISVKEVNMLAVDVVEEELQYFTNGQFATSEVLNGIVLELLGRIVFTL